MEFSISKVINILIYSFFGTTSPSVAVMAALFIAGEWRILEKSSLKGWWALIPCVRSYQLARCAGREPEGRVLCVVEFWEIVLKAIMILDAGQHNVFYNICNVTQSSIIIVGFLYKLKIFGGLIEVYSVKRRWMWLCPLPETRWIPMMVWGWSKKYQPQGTGDSGRTREYGQHGKRPDRQPDRTQHERLLPEKNPALGYPYVYSTGAYGSPAGWLRSRENDLRQRCQRLRKGESGDHAER